MNNKRKNNKNSCKYIESTFTLGTLRLKALFRSAQMGVNSLASTDISRYELSSIYFV